MGIDRERRVEQAPNITPELAEARESLDTLDGVDVIDEWQWRPLLRCWTLLCRLTIDSGGDLVPRRSDWVVFVDPAYPWGAIQIHPSIRNSVEATFPHQLLNRQVEPDTLWRTGRICVDLGVRALGRQGVDREPYSPGERLGWRLLRARAWLEAAVRGELFREGDPFELPDFNPTAKPLIAFGENSSSLITWSNEQARYGIVTFVRLREHPQVWAALAFKDLRGREVYAPRWGSYLSSSERPRANGLWFRLEETPLLDPWKAPTTWGELREAVRRQGLNLDPTLRPLIDRARDGAPHVLLVGFPIPAVVGGDLANMYWLAMQLPVIAIRNAPRRGFRPGREPVPDLSRLESFRDNEPIAWLRSENWDRETTAARGQFPSALTEAEVLLVGAGALGSAIGELLIRGGVRRITVCDDDVLLAGNLLRHTLALSDIAGLKAAALAERLNAISPHAVVRSITHAFPPNDDASKAILRTVDVVIDATGEDAVARSLSLYSWNSPKLFASVSLGLFALAGFSFTAFAASFPFQEMLAALRPRLDQQKEDHGDTEWPREGVGCWHPVFPARADEVWLLAAAAVQHLVESAMKESNEAELVVFERIEESGSFAGLRRLPG